MCCTSDSASPRYTDPEDSLEQQQIQLLLEDVEAVELVSDSLFRFFIHQKFSFFLRQRAIRLDASMVSNDHNYFVFEDLLHDVMRMHISHRRVFF